MLKLPLTWQNQIQKIIYDNRMLYEPWLESAGSYEELKERLKERGFKDLPIGAVPMINISKYHQIPKADTSSCEVRKTMLRKKHE